MIERSFDGVQAANGPEVYQSGRNASAAAPVEGLSYRDLDGILRRSLTGG
jgi:hypothetical protein